MSVPRHLWLLAPGQLVSWGTLYYGITFLAQPIQSETHWTSSIVFGSYSFGLLVTALASPWAGRQLAERGARVVLSVGSTLAALSCLVLATAPNLALFVAGWALAGVAMTLTLYEPAFAALREFEPHSFRRSITTLTLIAGFASTLFWPLTHYLVDRMGWRETLEVFAAAQILLCLPLHLCLPRFQGPPIEAQNSAPQDPGIFRSPRFWMLSVAFFAAAFFSGAMSAHAARLLRGQHVPETTMLWAISLFGPMQVAGRVLDLVWGSRTSLRITGTLAFAGLPVAILLLSATHAGADLTFVFAAVYGMANGVLTIVSGLAPAQLLPGFPYSVALGWLSASGMLARALGPGVTALLLTHLGDNTALTVLALTGLVGLFTFRNGARPQVD